MTQTQQTVVEGPIPELDNDLGLTLVCDCGAIRTFKFSAIFKLISGRDIRGVEVDAECENCNRNVLVAVGWMNAGPGYSMRPVAPDGEKMTLTDNAGLRLRKEG